MSDLNHSSQPDPRNPARRNSPNQAQLGGGVALILVLMSLGIGWWQNGNPAPPAINPAGPPNSTIEPQFAPAVVEPGVEQPGTKPQDLSNDSRETLIPKVTLKNQDGRVIYEGSIDLQPTLDRIANGERNQHPNDGTVFRNREGQLPRKPSGYYHEYVVPTPDERGPGPQRLVLGQGGEVYYTADHYRTFRKIKVKSPRPAK